MRCHWRLRPRAGHPPAPRDCDGCAPSAPTFWTSAHALDPEPLLTPGVLTRVAARALQSCVSGHSQCWWRDQDSSQVRICRPTVGKARLHVGCDVAQETLWSEFDQHPRRRLPGPRTGLVGHRRRSRPTSPTAIHKSPERSHWLP